MHDVVDLPRTAEQALAQAGIPVRARRATVVINIPDRPLVLAEIAGRLAEAGVSVEHAYTAVGTRASSRLVLAVDDVARARLVLGPATAGRNLDD